MQEQHQSLRQRSDITLTRKTKKICLLLFLSRIVRACLRQHLREQQPQAQCWEISLEGFSRDPSRFLSLKLPRYVFGKLSTFKLLELFIYSSPSSSSFLIVCLFLLLLLLWFKSEWDSSAPPTDSELQSKGLGFQNKANKPTETAAIVAEELSAHMASVKSGNTPRRVFSAPPDDIQLAVAAARNISSSSSTNKQGLSSSNLSLPPPPLPSSTSTSTSSASFGGLPPSVNSYSMGSKMPPGVNWRYVDVLGNQNTSLK